MLVENTARYNDIQIMSVVNNFKFIPLKVLSEILIDQDVYSSYQAVSRAVIRVRKKGFIRTTYYANNAKIIFLSKKGAKALAIGTGVSMDSINCPERLTGVNFFALEHTVKVAQLYRLFIRECRKHSLKLTQFTGDFSARYEYEFRGTSGKMIKRFIMPDAEIEIEHNDQRSKLWIEYDRGTESSKDVAVKYMKYLEYFDVNEEEVEKLPIIIFITESTRQRLSNLVVKDDSYNGEWDWYNTNKTYKNVVLKGVAMADGIRNMRSSVVERYLQPNQFLFTDYDSFKAKGFESKLRNFNAEEIPLIDILIQESK
ncbi:replication-relaxation family protein [Candidatus Dojkabacteria bacterium]|uniref:Replication-relaxation family protein n=1 Tax=Candidatus Dojkabacteria bacterium TaxID=2099670 RepID=A0A955HZH3_9BACT|nr:replication-relaxation family protein [Candidatus Dojkabacteria bacterium]